MQPGFRASRFSKLKCRAVPAKSVIVNTDPHENRWNEEPGLVYQLKCMSEKRPKELSQEKWNNVPMDFKAKYLGGVWFCENGEWDQHAAITLTTLEQRCNEMSAVLLRRDCLPPKVAMDVVRTANTRGGHEQPPEKQAEEHEQNDRPEAVRVCSAHDGNRCISLEVRDCNSRPHQSSKGMLRSRPLPSKDRSVCMGISLFLPAVCVPCARTQ